MLTQDLQGKDFYIPEAYELPFGIYFQLQTGITLKALEYLRLETVRMDLSNFHLKGGKWDIISCATDIIVIDI